MSPLFVTLAFVPLVMNQVACQAPQQYDCMVGATACQNTGSVIHNGASIACCKPGDSISSSMTAAFDSASGAYANHVCKCSPGGLAMINGRPMTPAEKQQFTQDMNKWSSGFQQNMNSFFTNLNTNLANMFNGWFY